MGMPDNEMATTATTAVSSAVASSSSSATSAITTQQGSSLKRAKQQQQHHQQQSSSSSNSNKSLWNVIAISPEPLVVPNEEAVPFEKVQLLGTGSTAKVYQVKSKLRQEPLQDATIAASSSTTTYALKQVETADAAAELHAEVQVLRRLDHPNIARVHEWYQQQQQDNKTVVSLVVEHLAGGDLLEQQPMPYKEDQAARVLRKILSAVSYLHQKGIVHRDLKPANILLDCSGGGEPKIIDFGLSKQFNIDTQQDSLEHAVMTEQVGSLLFMSPQVLQGQYNYKTDLWSIGVLAYVMLSGRFPFEGYTAEEITQQITSGRYAPMRGPAWRRVSRDAKEFCQALLTLEEKERPNALQALQLPFLQQQAQASTTAAPFAALYQSILVAAQTSTALDKLVAMILVHYHHSSVVVPQEYQDAFSALATDCKGTISYAQLRNAAAATLVEDTERGAVMCYTEFLALALLGQGCLLDVKHQDLLQAAFYKLCNGNIVITKEHFVSLLGGDSSNMQLMFQAYDLDQDGVISWLDFSQAVRRESCLAAALLRPDCHSSVSPSSSCWHHHHHHNPHHHAVCTDCETPHPVRI